MTSRRPSRTGTLSRRLPGGRSQPVQWYTLQPRFIARPDLDFGRRLSNRHRLASIHLVPANRHRLALAFPPRLAPKKHKRPEAAARKTQLAFPLIDPAPKYSVAGPPDTPHGGPCRWSPPSMRQANATPKSWHEKAPAFENRRRSRLPKHGNVRQGLFQHNPPIAVIPSNALCGGAKAAVFASPSVNSLKSVWDFFPFDGVLRLSSIFQIHRHYGSILPGPLRHLLLLQNQEWPQHRKSTPQNEKTDQNSSDRK